MGLIEDETKWAQVQAGLWLQPWFRGLSDQARLLFLFILSGTHRNPAGLMPLGRWKTKKGCKWGTKKTNLVAKEIEKTKKVYFDWWEDDDGWTLIPPLIWFRVYPARDRNNGLAVLRDALTAKGKTKLYEQWADETEQLKHGPEKGVIEGLGKALAETHGKNKILRDLILRDLILLRSAPGVQKVAQEEKSSPRRSGWWSGVKGWKPRR